MLKYQIHEKSSMISNSNTVIDPRTMMIKSLDASITNTAVS